MGMGAPRSGDPEEMGLLAEINVTPLVDVMLVLLIIFMVTAPLMMAKLPIELPKVSAEEIGRPKEPLIVGVDLNDQLYYSEEPISAEEMTSRLAQIAQTEPDRMIYVQADKGVPYGKVVDLLAMVGGSGLSKVSLMAEQPQ